LHLLATAVQKNSDCRLATILGSERAKEDEASSEEGTTAWKQETSSIKQVKVLYTAGDSNAVEYAGLLLGEGRSAHRHDGKHNSPKRRQQATQQRIATS